MTAIEDIACSELLKHITTTAQHGNDGNRIATATESLKQAAYQFVEILDERARLLANSAQFYAALRDASVIIDILPGSGLGYLCTGDVHCQQGHHSAAISIYDQGLEAVPESDQHYHQLQQHRIAAVANNDKRVDFISRLPLEIVITNILPKIDKLHFSDSSSEFLYVSRSWQERILKQPRGLRFALSNEDNTFKKGHEQLVRFAPNVRSLYGSLSKVIRLDDLFGRAHFSRLKDLLLGCDPTTPYPPLIHGLQMVADSLTHLTLFGCHGLQLRDILETCPNLEYLTTRHRDPIMPLSTSSIYPKMKHLVLYQRLKRPLKHETVISIISRFPSLRVVEIKPMAESSVLPLLHKYCPHLLAVYFGNPTYHFGCIADVVYPNRKGIESVYLKGPNSYKQHDLIQFLHSERDTLTLLQFNGDIEINDNAPWSLLNGHVLPPSDQPPDYNSPSFPRLIDFHFTNLNPSTTSVPMVQWILSNAHNLSAIHIHDIYFRPEIAKAMIKLKHLRKVHIDVVSNEDDDGVHQFLKHHIALGDRSTLKYVMVETSHIDISAKPWIPLLSRLPRLKNLELLAQAISENCIPFMAEIGQGCPVLENLTLGVDGADLADGLLVPLRNHPNIKWLRIGAADSLSVEDLVALCTFRDLTKLILSFNAADDVLEMLNKHIPNVEIDPYDDDDE